MVGLLCREIIPLEGQGCQIKLRPNSAFLIRKKEWDDIAASSVHGLIYDMLTIYDWYIDELNLEHLNITSDHRVHWQSTPLFAWTS